MNRVFIAGLAGADGSFNFIPSVYARPVETLNFTITQELFGNFEIFLMARNLTDPDIQTVCRSPDGNHEAIRTSHTAGYDLLLGVSANFRF